MTIDRSVYRRVLRRETHPSRSVVAVVLSVIVCLLLLAASTACVWWLFDLGARRQAEQSGAQMLQAFDTVRLFGLPLGEVLLGTAGVLAAVLGLLLVFAALLPGRRSRRGRSGERCAVLVDDGVLADAMADTTAARCGIDPSQVQVRLRGRIAHVRVTPTSGVPVNPETVRRVVHGSSRDIGFELTPRVRILEEGVLA